MDSQSEPPTRPADSDAGIEIEGDDEGHTRNTSGEPLHVARLDSYSYSMLNLQESQDNELDAILNELCELGTQFEKELSDLKRTTEDPPLKNMNQIVPELPDCGTVASATIRQSRTDSPDNDSAFSDSISMLSGESSASSGMRQSSLAEAAKQGKKLCFADDLPSVSRFAEEPMSHETAAAQSKEEKIRMALEKLKEASIRKLFIKVFCADGSAKSLLVDESMSVYTLTKMLADKCHVAMSTKWSLVETIPELHMERPYEEHENIVENLLLWTRDSPNRVLFVERPSKYEVFVQPEFFLADSTFQNQLNIDEDQRTALIEEFFMSPGTSGVAVPEVEGQLYLKSEGKKHWKKHFFILRASGLYYSPKGKSKLPKDLVCLTTFEMNCVYQGVGWKKKYRAPTDLGFAIKHPQIQSKACKNIKYLCAEDPQTLNKWMTGIRIAKYGRKMRENFNTIQRGILGSGLGDSDFERSSSVASIVEQISNAQEDASSEGGSSETIRRCRQARSASNETDLRSGQASGDRLAVDSSSVASGESLRRRDSMASSSGGSSSIGSMSSDRSSLASDTALAFDLDFPGGTIKRKPSILPRLPLTSTTRSLVKDSSSSEVACSLEDGISMISGFSLDSGGSLGRSTGKTLTLRRSQTDGQMSSTLARLKRRQPMDGASDSLNSTPSRNINSMAMPSSSASTLGDIPEKNPGSSRSLPVQSPVAPLTAKNLEKLAQDLAAKCQKTAASRSSRISDDLDYCESSTQSCSDATSLAPSNLSSVSLRLGGSAASVDSLPPPPTTLLSEERSWPSTTSVCSLPPPPSNLQTPVNSPPLSNQSTPTAEFPGAEYADISGTGSDTTTPTRSVDTSASPSRVKPPPPPQRSETTRLSTVKSVRFNDQTLPQQTSPMAPPDDFLRNLHRVMDKKWKVAQTLNTLRDSTAHEILGFRDPRLLSAEERRSQNDSPIHSLGQFRSSAIPIRPDLPGLACASPKAKPPPPKRSDATQLSPRALQCTTSPMGQRLGIF